MTSRRVWGVLLGLVLALAVFAPPAQAANAPTVLSAAITNPDGVVQAGSVCLELVGTGNCGGNNFANGTWTDQWVDEVDDPANGQPAGNYLIQVRSSTMDGTTRWYVQGNTAGTTIKADATPVALHSGALDLHFDLVVPTIAKLSGYVKDALGHGVPSLHVGMVRASGASVSVTTDADGRYDFGYTRAKTYALTVTASTEYGGTSGTAVVPAAGSYEAPDLVVQLASAIHGQVTGAGGQPLPLIYVEVYTAGTHVYQGSGYTDQLGQYRIPGLGNQDLVARYTDGFGGHEARLYVSGEPNSFVGEVPFSLMSGEDRHLPDMALVPKVPDIPVPHNLSGTVTDTDQHPLPGIAVTSPTDPNLYAVTDRLGNWYLDAPAGSYVLRFADSGTWSTNVFAAGHDWVAEYYRGAYQESTATTVVVAGGARTGLDVTLSMVPFGASNPPVVSGTRAAGGVLTASTGTWTAMPLTRFDTTWWRGADQVGSGPSYAVGAGDAGSTLQARVVATNGSLTATASSASVTIDRLASVVAGRGASPKRGVVKLTITVTSTGLTPGGTLTVRRGARVVKSGVVLVGGRVVVKLKRQPSGTRQFTASYSGSAQISGSSVGVKVRVR